MKVLRNITFLFLLFCFQGLQAQVEFKATPSRTRIGVNEKVRIEFSMNQDGDNFVPPSFQGFDASGLGQYINNSWINGKTSFNKSYTYLLSPKAKGTFTIGSATIEIGGATYKTAPFKIVVGDAVANPNPQPRYDPFDPFGRRRQQEQQPEPTVDNPNEGIHLVAEVQNTSPYVNQPVNVVYKLYVSNGAGVSSFIEKESPKYNDFWSQIEITDGRTMTIQNGTYNGQPARYVVLRKAVLYPQKSGRLQLEPLVVDMTVQVPYGPRDFFGRQAVKEVKTTATTGKRYINVRALPEAGKPDDFSGAVGNFDFSVIPSKTTSTNGESIQLTVKVSGKGNLKLLSLPKPVVPPALEMYDPEHKEDVKVPLTGMTGSVSDVYTLVPNAKGKYPIKAMSFSWFDLASGTYKTKTADEIMVNVLNVPASAATASAKAGAGKQEVTATEQFRYVATQTSLSAMGGEDFYGSGLFYTLLFLPFALIPVVVLVRRKKEAYDSDVEGNKTRTNSKLAKKFLTAAKKELGNKEPFYLALEKALHNFLKAKLRIETSELSRDNIQELLLSRKADADTVNDFAKIMDNCEFARYAPSSGTAMQQDYESAVSVITRLEKQIS
jgi:BatD DUF11 like domain